MAPRNYNKKLKRGGERSDLSPYEECVIQGITDLGDKVVSQAFEKTHDISKLGIEAVKKAIIEKKCKPLLQAAPVKGGRSRAMTLRQRKKLSKRKRQKKTSRTKRTHKHR
jgi:hypothetical protein